MVSLVQVVASALFVAASLAAPTIEKRGEVCTFTIECTNSEGGGGPGQAPLDNTSCGENIVAGESHLLWNADVGNDLDLTHTVPASVWKGAGEISIVSGWNGGDNALTECKYTLNGQTHSAPVQNSLSSGIVSVSKSKCEWTLPCNP